MKIILDTNVFVSGIFFVGPPYQILKAWRDGVLKLVVSDEIFEEYQRVGKELGVQFPMVDLQPILDMVLEKSQMFHLKSFPESITDDPDDDKFLACALACKSKIIVSGDKHLLKVNGFRGINIIKPREFVDTFLTDCVNN